MAIKIITDSASDILQTEAQAMGITVVPLTYRWDGVEYLDSIDMDHKEFFEKLVNSDTLPKTSQVTPAGFEAAIKKVVEAGDEALVITVSSKLSGTYQSAVIAASEFEGKAVAVDSLSGTVGQRVLVQMALNYVAEGLDMNTIVEKLLEDRNHVKILAKVDTLEYLKKGGRVSAAVAFAGGLLSIKPVLTVVDGSIVVIGKARGSKNANNLLRKFVEESNGIDFNQPFYLVYSGASDENLQQYIQDSKDLYEGQTDNLPITTIGTVIGTHVGPGAIGIAFYEKKKQF